MTFPVVLAELDSPVPREVLSLMQGYRSPDPLGLPAPTAAEQTPKHPSQRFKIRLKI